jgi:very-short-patch-repair endonuclease
LFRPAKLRTGIDDSDKQHGDVKITTFVNGEPQTKTVQITTVMNQHRIAHNRALRMSINKTKTERLLWNALQHNPFHPHMKLQHPIFWEADRYYIIDIYFDKIGIAIEIDGSSHRGRSAYDKQRDARLENKGIITWRFPAWRVFQHTEDVADEIIRRLRKM